MTCFRKSTCTLRRGPPAHLFEPAEQMSSNRPPFGTDWTRWSSTFTNMLRNWARLICVWNLLLDEKGKPDITVPPRPDRPGGLVSINSQTQQLSYSGNYYAFPHYSKLIQKGRTFSPPGATCPVLSMLRPRIRMAAMCLWLPTATVVNSRCSGRSAPAH